ncbi:MAG: hypothetical protein ABUL63_02700 [Acidobacteriota bacterium]
MMDEQNRWTARLLEASLQSSGLSEREIEERLGWEAGLLGRILDGTAECPPLQLLAFLAELNAERRGGAPGLRRGERGTQMVQELIERFRSLGYGPPGAAPAVFPAPVTDDVERTVEEALQRAFGKDFGKEARGGG